MHTEILIQNQMCTYLQHAALHVTYMWRISCVDRVSFDFHAYYSMEGGLIH